MQQADKPESQRRNDSSTLSRSFVSRLLDVIGVDFDADAPAQELYVHHESALVRLRDQEFSRSHVDDGSLSYLHASKRFAKVSVLADGPTIDLSVLVVL